MKQHWSRFLAVATAALLTPALFAASHPNSEKYKDSSIRNASARSGSASLEARALFNRDKTTDLELTTASFESNAAAAGEISRVQLRFPTGAATSLDGNGGGVFATTLTGLAPHAVVGVTANVRGIDANRTDVVMLDETVKKRPDVEAVSLTAPATAIRGRNVRIHATFRELNGDVGARADMRLFANGQLVDRAEYTWIDAGGIVDCAFAPTIDMTGTVTLTVVADSINPGDWDTSNNSASAQITMTDQVDQFYGWNTSAAQEEFQYYSYDKYPFGEYSYTRQGTNQTFGFNGTLRAEVPQNDMKAHVTVTSGGVSLYDNSTVEFFPPWTGWWGTCSESMTNQPEVTVCYDRDRLYTRVDIYAGAGDAIYRSYGWSTQQNPWAPPEPRFEWDYTYADHSMKAPFGASVEMKVDFEAAGQKWSATQAMPINQTQTRNYDQAYRCYYDDFYNMDVCGEYHDHSVTRLGTGYGFSQTGQ